MGGEGSREGGRDRDREGDREMIMMGVRYSLNLEYGVNGHGDWMEGLFVDSFSNSLLDLVLVIECATQ